MQEMPPLSALRAFEAAIRHGSLSGAARELNVTHSAVAQQARRLEGWFGVPLLRREGRGIAPTAAGARLAGGLSTGFAALRDAVEALTGETEEKPLHITTTPTFAAYWLMPRIGAFRAAHPEVEVMIHPTVDVIDLQRDGYDVAFRYGAGDWPGLESSQLLEVDFVVAAAASLLQGRVIETPADLLGLPRLQEYGVDEWQRWLQAHGVSEAQDRNVAHIPGHLAIQAIRDGVGVGMTARSWLAEDIESGRVVALFDGADDRGGLGYHVVAPPGPHRKALKVFLRWVKNDAAKGRAGG